jgi:glycosyltransferase involved in cell wall biosynthesis
MISIVIPAHNRSEFLDRTLQSAANQEGVDFEIIVIDDNSTEDLSTIVNKYQCVYVKNNMNRGAQYSRNKGVELSRFPYIAFLDSDDIWHCTNKLKRQLDIISTNDKVTLVYTPLRLIDENDTILQEASCDSNIEIIKNPMSAMLSKDFIGTYSSAMMRKRDFVFVGGCDEDLPARQDWDLWIRLAGKGDIVKDSRISTSYRMHPSQISSSGEKKLIGYLCVLEKHFGKYHLNLKTKTAYYKNLFKVALLVGFIGGGDKIQLPDIDKLLIRWLSKLSLINKMPLAGRLFAKLLKKTYLFRGVTIN